MTNSLCCNLGDNLRLYPLCEVVYPHDQEFKFPRRHKIRPKRSNTTSRKIRVMSQSGGAHMGRGEGRRVFHIDQTS